MSEKDFNAWNIRKQRLDSNGNNYPYNVREIWWCSLGVNIGFEEDGDGARAERPVVIIRGFNKQLCWVASLTTSQKDNPYYFHVGMVADRQSSAIISQMRPIDTKRFINLVCVMDQDIFDRMRKAIKGLLRWLLVSLSFRRVLVL